MSLLNWFSNSPLKSFQIGANCSWSATRSLEIRGKFSNKSHQHYFCPASQPAGLKLVNRSSFRREPMYVALFMPLVKILQLILSNNRPFSPGMFTYYGCLPNFKWCSGRNSSLKGFQSTPFFPPKPSEFTKISHGATANLYCIN